METCTLPISLRFSLCVCFLFPCPVFVSRSRLLIVVGCCWLFIVTLTGCLCHCHCLMMCLRKTAQGDAHGMSVQLNTSVTAIKYFAELFGTVYAARLKRLVIIDFSRTAQVFGGVCIASWDRMNSEVVLIEVADLCCRPHSTFLEYLTFCGYSSALHQPSFRRRVSLRSLVFLCLFCLLPDTLCH